MTDATDVTGALYDGDARFLQCQEVCRGGSGIPPLRKRDIWLLYCELLDYSTRRLG